MTSRSVAHWPETTFGRLARIGNGADYSGVEVEHGGYPVYGSGGEFRRASSYLFDGESVLFGRKGTVDRPLYVSGKFWTVDTMFYSVIDRSRLLPRFAYYWATTLPFRAWATDTALPSMTSSAIKAAPIMLPPMREQRAIAGYLDRETAQIDAFIAKNEELIALLTERRAAAIEIAVAPRTTPSTWDVCQVRRLGLRNDSGVSVNGYSIPAEGNEVGVLKTGAVSKGFFDPTENKRVVEEDLERVATPVRAGTLIVNRANTPELVGSAGYVAHDYATLFLSDKLWQLTFASADPAFIHFWTLSNAYRSQLRGLSVGASASMQNLSYADFLSVSIAVPPLQDQSRIVEELRRTTGRIDAAVKVAQRGIELARERRAAVISAAVTGKIDVRRAA